jgi:hypothetical protein
LRRRKKKVAAEPARYEMHYQDETHVETNPYLCKVWHRRGVQPTLPAAGTNRRVTVFGSVEALGRGRVEVLCAGQDSACFVLYLEALERRHVATGREIYLVLDNGPAHTSKRSMAALEERAAWLHVIWLARYSPELNPKEPRPSYDRGSAQQPQESGAYHGGTPRPSPRWLHSAGGPTLPSCRGAAVGDRAA